MLRAFRNASKKLQPLARAKPQRRQYTIEELSGNKWLFPDEDTSVSLNILFPNLPILSLNSNQFLERNPLPQVHCYVQYQENAYR